MIQYTHYMFGTRTLKVHTKKTKNKDKILKVSTGKKYVTLASGVRMALDFSIAILETRNQKKMPWKYWKNLFLS